jgi:hypothetical protein
MRSAQSQQFGTHKLTYLASSAGAAASAAASAGLAASLGCALAAAAASTGFTASATAALGPSLGDALGASFGVPFGPTFGDSLAAAGPTCGDAAAAASLPLLCCLLPLFFGCSAAAGLASAAAGAGAAAAAAAGAGAACRGEQDKRRKQRRKEGQTYRGRRHAERLVLGPGCALTILGTVPGIHHAHTRRVKAGASAKEGASSLDPVPGTAATTTSQELGFAGAGTLCALRAHLMHTRDSSEQRQVERRKRRVCTRSPHSDASERPRRLHVTKTQDHVCTPVLEALLGVNAVVTWFFFSITQIRFACGPARNASGALGRLTFVLPRVS